MKYILPVIVLLFLYFSSSAQHMATATAEFESLLSSGEQQPFWLTANQNGIYSNQGKSLELLSINGTYQWDSLLNSNFHLELGTHLLTSYAQEFNFQANELYSKIYWKGWKLEGGWFKEPGYFNGISSTNGNIDRSNNARPYPRIRFGTNEFIPFLFWKNWLSFKAEYDEGWLNDERWVMGTRLHHKSLYGKIQIQKSSLSLGLNHYVMWGGTSPDHGQLPQSLEDYFVYITGSVGGSNFPVTDQMNVAGNQFGSYHVQFNHTLENISLSLYFNHLFEDHSGMEFKNARDNLMGLYVEFHKKSIIDAVLYEFMYTKHQGGSVHVQGSTGLDNYYNHGVYHSGYSYKGNMMVSPLFAPVNIQDGIVRGISNNRMIMHHLGFKGHLSDRFAWNGMLTYTQNYGTYPTPFDPEKNQISSLLAINYHNTNLPFDLSFSLAADAGQLYENRVGALLKISKTF